MASYIYSDEVKQARAKFDLEQNIYALFNFELAENVNKSFEVIYTPSEIEGEIGTFEKKELKVPNSSADIAVQDFSYVKDYAKVSSAYKIKDYSKASSACKIKDYSKDAGAL